MQKQSTLNRRYIPAAELQDTAPRKVVSIRKGRGYAAVIDAWRAALARQQVAS